MLRRLKNINKLHEQDKEAILYNLDALLRAMADLFTDKDILKDINSSDTTLMERVALIESFSKEEQNTIFAILDAFVSKRKLKSTLKNVLQDMD